MSTEYNPYMLDDDHAYDMQHSKFELGQGKLRDIQKDISQRRERSAQLLAELGYSPQQRKSSHYADMVTHRQHYMDNRELYDSFISQCLEVGTLDTLLIALERYVQS